MERLEFRVLGPLEVSAGGEPLPLGGARQRALLALLLLKEGRVVSRDRIVDALWGERPPATAANAVQVAVHALRKQFGPERVLTQGAGYRLAFESGELDLARFEQLLEQADREPAPNAAATLRDALSLRRGALLADLSDVPFVAAERDRVEELVLLALDRRIDADLEVGRHRELVGELEALVAEHPYREGFRARLMLALYRSGRQADALEAYRQARAALLDDLGIDPSKELRELEAAILRHDSELESVSRAVPSNLPAPARALVGRELELAAVTALLRAPDTRLVTLTGPGGTGKTRLALESAAELRGDFGGGVFFADLAPLPDATLVGPTLARALGVRDASEDAFVERVTASLGDRAILLLVDNFEHVLAAAPLVAELVARIPTLRVLGTSREPLRLRAEREYRVPPLGLPARSDTGILEAARRSEAVQLFVTRARAARPDFELTEENAVSVVAICRALDGLPLALELAAPRVQLLSPAALRDRLSDRLGVLAAGERDLPERQRTLRAAIDWSYRLLDAPEQALLTGLSVFAGGWTLEAAETVAGAELTTLGSLVEKSLVRSEPGGNGAPRFSMLETVREYALERLRESSDDHATRSRHAEFFARLAERLEPDLHTVPALDEAAREHDNVRAALEHSLSSGDIATTLRVCALARFWYVRGYVGEGRTWIDRALARPGGPRGRRARVLYWAATLAWTSGDHAVASARARESLELARDANDELAQLRALTALGLGHLGAGDLVTSRAFHAESLELARSLGRDRDVAVSLANIADVEVMLEDFERAETLARESLEINRRIGDVEGAGVSLLVIAASLVERGRNAEAVPLIVESIHCFRRVDFKDFLASALVALARTRVSDDPSDAARVLGAAAALRAPLGPAQFPWEQTWVELVLEQIRASLGSRAEAELDAGASAIEETIEEAVAGPG